MFASQNRINVIMQDRKGRCSIDDIMSLRYQEHGSRFQSGWYKLWSNNHIVLNAENAFAFKEVQLTCKLKILLFNQIEIFFIIKNAYGHLGIQRKTTENSSHDL